MVCCSYLWPIMGIVSFAVALVANYASIATDLFGDLDQGELSDKYQTTITPAGWIFSIWGIIYIWQGLWLGYTTYCSFKMINRGKVYFSPLFWIFYILANLCNATWIAVFAAEEITLAMIFLVSIWFSLIIAGISAHRFLMYTIPSAVFSNDDDELWYYPQSLVLSIKQGVSNRLCNLCFCCCNPCCCNDEKSLLYAFVLNGIGIYATWCNIASCLNITIFLIYELEWSNDNAVNVGLIILASSIVLYWICDFIVFRNILRYTFTPYFVLIWAFLGVLSKYSYEDYDSSVVIAILLLCAIVASVIKVILSMVLIRKNNEAVSKDADNIYGGSGNANNITFDTTI